MFVLPRRAINSKNLRNVAKNCRSLCSDKSQTLQTGSSYSDANAKDGSGSLGYGEKEVCLLGPLDARMPLPGNTGVAPINPLFQEVFSFKPQTENCRQIFSEIPEERQKNALTQFACAIANNIISSGAVLECIAYECPQLLKRDFADLFPTLDIRGDNFTVLTICQKTEEDMSKWSEKIESERSILEESFVLTAQAICAALQNVGYWADFIHPNSGKPQSSSSLTNSTMFETDMRYSHFGFAIEDLGCCKVISHHLWGTHSFVGAIFTTASVNSVEIKRMLQKRTQK